MAKDITDGIDLKCKKAGCEGKIHVTFRQWYKRDFMIAEDGKCIQFCDGNATDSPIVCSLCGSQYKFNTLFEVSEEDLAAIMTYIKATAPKAYPYVIGGGAYASPGGTAVGEGGILIENQRNDLEINIITNGKKRTISISSK